MYTQNNNGITLKHVFLERYKIKKCSELSYAENIIFNFYDVIHAFNGKELVLNSIENIISNKGIGFTGASCTVIPLDEWIEDFKEVVGYEKALTQPVMFFCVGDDIDPEEVIVTLPEAHYYARVVFEIYLELYPDDKSTLGRYIEMMKDIKIHLLGE